MKCQYRVPVKPRLVKRRNRASHDIASGLDSLQALDWSAHPCSELRLREEDQAQRRSTGMTSLNPPDDAAAFRDAVSDPLAFEAVFDRHWPRIRHYCVVRAGTPGEDVAAETFRVAFDNRRRYDGRANAGPWLFGIATNLLRDLFRRSARSERALRRAMGELETDPFDSAVERLDAERLGPVLTAALQDLAPMARETLLLHACAELSYDEIARATAVPVGTVSSRIHRACAQVRAYLNSQEVSR